MEGNQLTNIWQVWHRIWTQDDREQIQQVAGVGLEPVTAALWVRRANHSATLPQIFGMVHVQSTLPKLKQLAHE